MRRIAGSAGTIRENLAVLNGFTKPKSQPNDAFELFQAQLDQILNPDYEFDDVGNRTATIQSGNDVHSAEITYGYDNLHRLDTATYVHSQLDPDGAETFDMDVLSNRTRYDDARDGPTISYALNNAANEYTEIDSEAITYTPSGCLRQDDRNYRYGYDFEDRLKRVKRKAIGPGGGNGRESGAEEKRARPAGRVEDARRAYTGKISSAT